MIHFIRFHVLINCFILIRNSTLKCYANKVNCEKEAVNQKNKICNFQLLVLCKFILFFSKREEKVKKDCHGG